MRLFLVLLLAGIFSVQASDDLKINGDFIGSSLGAPSPKLWWKNHAKRPGIGVSKVVAGKKAGEMALQVKTEAVKTPFYTVECKSKAGDVLEIEADVEGTGSIQFGYYAYDAKHHYISSVAGRVMPVNGILEGKDKLQIKDFPGGRATAYIRIAITVLPKSNLTFSDVEAEFDD